MEIFEFAMKMEMDGKAFYEKQAALASRKELKEILLTLAGEEMQHFMFFKKMRDGETKEAVGELSGQTDTLNKVKNIFVDLSTSKESKSFGDDEIAAWSKALDIEEKAEKFYREKAQIEDDVDKKRLLNMIADEERNHVHMIDGILTYLKFPEAFADSAQFKNFQSLEGH